MDTLLSIFSFLFFEMLPNFRPFLFFFDFAPRCFLLFPPSNQAATNAARVHVVNVHSGKKIRKKKEDEDQEKMDTSPDIAVGSQLSKPLQHTTNRLQAHAQLQHFNIKQEVRCKRKPDGKVNTSCKVD